MSVTPAKVCVPQAQLSICVRRPPTAIMVQTQHVMTREVSISIAAAYPPVNADTQSCGDYIPQSILSEDTKRN